MASFYNKNKIQYDTTLSLPDTKKLSWYENNPDSGPGILFFSGGSALQSLSRHLTAFTHNSIHIITPFDSGGSSANLRKAFDMPAVGDIRNRLIALSDPSCTGNPEACALFSYRMPRTESPGNLLDSLSQMISGEHPLTAGVSGPTQKTIRDHLQNFMERMPYDFDLGGASIGNLMLASAYLSHHRQLDQAIRLFSKLTHVRGIVRPVVDEHLHLTVRLENNETVVGQHLITGKERMPLNSMIKQIILSEKEINPLPVNVSVPKHIQALIKKADMIAYPMGSFYSSLISNLLPHGVGDTISRVSCPKIYIPNIGPDPEAIGLDLADQVEILLSFLKKDNPIGIATEQVLHFILVDKANGNYTGGIDEERIRKMGVDILDCPLITPRSAPLIDEELLVPLLLSFT